MSIRAARRSAQLLLDVLAGQADPGDVLAPDARAWAPHRGWAEGRAAAGQLEALRADLSIGALMVESMVAARDLVVVEARLTLTEGRAAPVTVTIDLDDAMRATEVRAYLDPMALRRR
jgi:hypothetical protein